MKCVRVRNYNNWLLKNNVGNKKIQAMNNSEIQTQSIIWHSGWHWYFYQFPKRHNNNNNRLVHTLIYITYYYTIVISGTV